MKRETQRDFLVKLSASGGDSESDRQTEEKFMLSAGILHIVNFQICEEGGVPSASLFLPPPPRVLSTFPPHNYVSTSFSARFLSNTFTGMCSTLSEKGMLSVSHLIQKILLPVMEFRVRRRGKEGY